MSGIAAVLSDAWLALQVAAVALAISVLLFGFIALCVKGREAVEAGIRAIAEVRLNLAFYFFDALFDRDHRRAAFSYDGVLAGDCE